MSNSPIPNVRAQREANRTKHLRRAEHLEELVHAYDEWHDRISEFPGIAAGSPDAHVADELKAKLRDAARSAEEAAALARERATEIAACLAGLPHG
jgi:hypothetical protein